MMKRILVIFRFILIFSVFFLTDISLFYNEFCCNFCLGKGTFIPFVSGFICDGRENGLDRLLFAESTYFFEIPVDTIINDGEYIHDPIVRKEILVEHDIPAVPQDGPANCLPACAEAVDRSFGGKMTQKDIRELPTLGGDPYYHALTDCKVWGAYEKRTGCFVTGFTPSEYSFDYILLNMIQGNRVVINLNLSNVGHCVVMQKIVQETTVEPDGTISRKLIYYAMDPGVKGQITRISKRKIMNAYNIFYIHPPQKVD